MQIPCHSGKTGAARTILWHYSCSPAPTNLAAAAPGHIVLHCLPAYRDKEISEETLELHADTIFQQAENRLHAQKAILVELAK